MTQPEQDAQLIRVKLNAETAKIAWKDLQRYFAAGSTLYVSADLDLIDAALAFNQNDTRAVELWLTQARLAPVSNDQAREWLTQDRWLWAVVVSPWVLVQMPA